MVAATLVTCAACVSVEPQVETPGGSADDGGAVTATVPPDAGSLEGPPPEAGEAAAGGETPEAATTDCPSDPNGEDPVLGCSCPQVGATVCVEAGSGFLCAPVPAMVGAVYEGPTWVTASEVSCSDGSTSDAQDQNDDGTIADAAGGTSSSSGGNTFSGSGGTVSSSGSSGSGSGGTASSSGSGSSGSIVGSTDSGAGTGPCRSVADCGPGELCGFNVMDGCSIGGICFPAMGPGPTCPSYAAGCACDGTEINLVCNGYPAGFAFKPLVHPGSCAVPPGDAAGPCMADGDCGAGGGDDAALVGD